MSQSKGDLLETHTHTNVDVVMKMPKNQQVPVVSRIIFYVRKGRPPVLGDLPP